MSVGGEFLVWFVRKNCCNVVLLCGLCCFVSVSLWLWCQVVFMWLFLFGLCVKVCCYVVLLCLLCRLLIAFSVIVCVVAVMNSFVRFVRVVFVLNSHVRMYVRSRGRSWCLELLGCVCCVCCKWLQ